MRTKDMRTRNMLLDRRDFMGMLAGTAAGIALPGCAVQTARSRSASSHRLPNLIIIFTDDQGYNDLGCFGSPLIKTPNIDQMAREGMNFTDFYVAAPVCTPSRAALMTGCYPQRVGLASPQLVLTPQSTIGINPKETTIAELLRGRGYATACIGKWHLGHLPPFLPTRHGFDSYFGIPYSNDMRPPSLMRNEEVIEQHAIQETLTERYTDEALRFIRANGRQPFFLYLAHTMPHTPLHVSERFKGKSARGLYGDVIECIDWSTGQILDALKTLNIDKDTLVVFTSDNGPWLVMGENGGSATPLRAGKGTTYEGGMRVPCVMRWTGRIPASTVCSEVATTLDLLPTFAALAGIEPPTDRIIDGKDISRLMFGVPGATSPHEAFFYYFMDHLQAVRSGRWKLMFERTRHMEVPFNRVTSGSDMERVPEALYDLETDISEQHNVIADHPDVAERLRALADKMRDDLGDSSLLDPSKGRQGKNRRPPGRLGK
jgi:arylsulfatase A-like enzyme